MKISEKGLFIVYIIGALILSRVPYVSVPFNWLETYFHELSHGLAALATGGHVERIELYLTGGGKCFTVGGRSSVIAFAGYTGAILWGAAIYLGAQASGKSSRWLAFAISGIIVISGVLWARDISTIIILIILAGILYVSFRYVLGSIFPRIMEFTGIYVLISAIHSPLNLIDGRHRGDGSTLSELTYIPEIIWVAIWIALGVAALYGVWRLHGKQEAMTARQAGVVTPKH
jgi:hypothetical protein